MAVSDRAQEAHLSSIICSTADEMEARIGLTSAKAERMIDEHWRAIDALADEPLVRRTIEGADQIKATIRGAMMHRS